MATTRASSPGTRPEHQYDVFLNFRGEDVRHTFVSHLYERLLEEDVETFIDSEEFEKGEEIQKILDVIQVSRISIMVFSENYAESTWCLDEAVKIMKCRKERRHKVIPVFYHMEPGVVRRQSGTFGKAFLEHQRDWELQCKVPTWKAALEKAGFLSGYVFNKDKSEAEEIRKMVHYIQEKLEDLKASESDRNANYGIGERMIEKIQSLLCMEDEDHTRVVGIWGRDDDDVELATSLAEAVLDRECSYFDGSWFIECVSEDTREVGIEELHHELVFSIFYGEPIPSVSAMMGNLQRRRVFLVFGDIDDISQFDGLIGDAEMHREGSKIIITSKNKELLLQIAGPHGILEVCNEAPVESRSSRSTRQVYLRDYDNSSGGKEWEYKKSSKTGIQGWSTRPSDEVGSYDDDDDDDDEENGTAFNPPGSFPQYDSRPQGNGAFSSSNLYPADPGYNFVSSSEESFGRNFVSPFLPHSFTHSGSSGFGVPSAHELHGGQSNVQGAFGGGQVDGNCCQLPPFGGGPPHYHGQHLLFTADGTVIAVPGYTPQYPSNMPPFN